MSLAEVRDLANGHRAGEFEAALRLSQRAVLDQRTPVRGPISDEPASGRIEVVQRRDLAILCGGAQADESAHREVAPPLGAHLGFLRRAPSDAAAA